MYWLQDTGEYKSSRLFTMNSRTRKWQCLLSFECDRKCTYAAEGRRLSPVGVVALRSPHGGFGGPVATAAGPLATLLGHAVAGWAHGVRSRAHVVRGGAAGPSLHAVRVVTCRTNGRVLRQEYSERGTLRERDKSTSETGSDVTKQSRAVFRRFNAAYH